MDRNEFIENYLGGIFAVIAAAAAVMEMILGGFSVESIVACIKDLFGMMAVVIIFFFVVKSEWPIKSFRKKLEKAMEGVEESYSPLIREHVANEGNASDVAVNQKFIRYDLARKVSSLFGDQCNDYMRFFELKATDPDKITFFARQKFFGESFDPETIAGHTKGYLDKKHEGIDVTYQANKDGASIVVSFGRVLKSQRDIEKILGIIDDVLFVFTVENKQ